MNIDRTLSQAVLEASQNFKVVLLTGPRQVGKTTLLKKLEQGERSYLSFDDVDARFAAKEDPAGFVQRLKLPVLIDEVQYVPEIFPYIKMRVDQSAEKGTVWLTGSQQFAMMKNVSESMAGRVAILELRGISLSEEEGQMQTPPFLPTLECLQAREQSAQPISLDQIFHKIWRGSYLDVVTAQGKNWEQFYQSYVTTYVERDVREYLGINNVMVFRKFMQVAAARTGQVVNFRNIAKDVGVSEPTIKSWFNVLLASGLIVFLQPYMNNLTKRLTKTPKFHFLDTGLCCYLTKWLNPEVLESGAMAGALLETYVVSEIYKSYIHHGRTPQLYFYADQDQREIDLLIQENGVLHPVEIKKATSIRNTQFKGFEYLSILKTQIGHGCVLCFRDSMIPYNAGIDLVPIGYL